MLVVYTALFGKYDTLRDPPAGFDNCKFVCFTDQKDIQSDVWKFVEVEEIGTPPNLMNRRYKLLPHKYLQDFDQSLYIDSNLTVVSDPALLITKYSDREFVLPRHFERNCIFDEAVECMTLRKGRIEDIVSQMRYYKTQGMPRHFGLGENNILLRKHNNPQVIQLMEEWWQQLNTHSARDQLSLAYVLWRSGEHFSFMDESARNGPDIFEYENHSVESKGNLFSKIQNKLLFAFRRFYYSIFAHW